MRDKPTMREVYELFFWALTRQIFTPKELEELMCELWGDC